MGLPMDDLHAPTVPSGPTSRGGERDISKLTMNQLFREKEKIESELKLLSDVLKSVRIPKSLLFLIRRGTVSCVDTCGSRLAWGKHGDPFTYVRWFSKR